jgi:hypothetical protein
MKYPRLLFFATELREARVYLRLEVYETPPESWLDARSAGPERLAMHQLTTDAISVCTEAIVEH